MTHSSSPTTVEGDETGESNETGENDSTGVPEQPNPLPPPGEPEVTGWPPTATCGCSGPETASSHQTGCPDRGNRGTSQHRMTMKRFECMEEGCSAVIEAETDEELLDQAREHAAEKHPDLELDDATVEAIHENTVTI